MNNSRIQIKFAEDIDEERWDNFIVRHPKASPYHLFAWRKAIEEAYKHKCIYLFAEKNNEILGVLPIVRIHFIGIINEMVSLPFCDLGNCIADSKEVQDLLCNEALHYKEMNKATRYQIRGDLYRTYTVQTKFEIRETKKVRMLFGFSGKSDELFNNFNSKLRSQVRKAVKNGVVFFWGDIKDIDRAYNVFSKNMHELGSPVHSKSFLSSVMTHYGARAKLGIAKFQGKTIGMGIILLGSNSVSIPWASTDREYNRLGPNMLLYWNFLKYSVDNNYTFFDFGRSSENEGTYKFKKQWGAKPIPLVWYDSIDTHKIKKELSIIDNSKRERTAALWKKLPQTMANVLGPHIRKYISL